MCTIQARIEDCNKEINVIQESLTVLMRDTMAKLHDKLVGNGFSSELCHETYSNHTLGFSNGKQISVKINCFDERGFYPTFIINIGYKNSFMDMKFMYEIGSDKIYRLSLTPRRVSSEMYLNRNLNPAIKDIGLVDFLYKETLNFS